MYEEKVKRIRRSISIAEAELGRIKENRKIPRKGKEGKTEKKQLKNVKQSPQLMLTYGKTKSKA